MCASQSCLNALIWVETSFFQNDSFQFFPTMMERWNNDQKLTDRMKEETAARQKEQLKIDRWIYMQRIGS